MGFKEYLCETLDVEKKTIKDVMKELFGRNSNYMILTGHGYEADYDIESGRIRYSDDLKHQDKEEQVRIKNATKKDLDEKKRIAKNVLDRYKKDKTKSLEHHKNEFHHDDAPLTYIEQMRLLRGETIGRKGM